MTPSPEGGARLRPSHEALLAVVLSTSSADTVARWDALRDREQWDDDARQLLPMLARTLFEAGVGTPEVARLIPMGQRTWAHNQMLFHRLDDALAVLDAAGVRTLALKGVPLALRHYADPSLRPMADADLFVEPETVADAVAALGGAGWVVERELHEDFVARRCEVELRSPDGQALVDLHWRLVPWVGRSWTAPDPALWDGAARLRIVDHTTLEPAPHDLLLHVILHAYRSGWTTVPRWVADVVVLLRSSGDAFDWDRFTKRVLTARLSLPVADALTYVTTTFDAPVPEPVRVTLSGARSTRRERAKHRLAARPIAYRRRRVVGTAPDLVTGWARISVNYSPVGAFRSLGPFLRGRTHVDRVWTLPMVSAKRRILRRRARSAR